MFSTEERMSTTSLNASRIPGVNDTVRPCQSSWTPSRSRSNVFVNGDTTTTIGVNIGGSPRSSLSQPITWVRDSDMWLTRYEELGEATVQTNCASRSAITSLISCAPSMRCRTVNELASAPGLNPTTYRPAGNDVLPDSSAGDACARTALSGDFASVTTSSIGQCLASRIAAAGAR